MLSHNTAQTYTQIFSSRERKQIFHKYLATPTCSFPPSFAPLDFSCLVYCFVLLIKCNKIITLVRSTQCALNCEGENLKGEIYLALFIISHTIIFAWISLEEDELLTGDWIFNHDDGKYVANYIEMDFMNILGKIE
jgi:hypothetical protein